MLFHAGLWPLSILYYHHSNYKLCHFMRDYSHYQFILVIRFINHIIIYGVLTEFDSFIVVVINCYILCNVLTRLNFYFDCGYCEPLYLHLYTILFLYLCTSTLILKRNLMFTHFQCQQVRKLI